MTPSEKRIVDELTNDYFNRITATELYRTADIEQGVSCMGSIDSCDMCILEKCECFHPYQKEQLIILLEEKLASLKEDL